MIWPDQLIKDIASRRAVLFFGSGISMNSLAQDGTTKPKSWVNFLKEACNRPAVTSSLRKEILRLINKNDLLTACEVIRREIGRDDFITLVKDVFQNPGFKPAHIHELLWKLDLRISITPNFDNIYDVLVAQRGNGTVTTKRYCDGDVADALRRNERVLIKSHGSVTHSDELIFTRVDYAKARSKHGQFYELLDALLRTHTFLFIGCGLEDPDIRLLLENYCFRHEHAPQHYFVMPSKQFSSKSRAVFEDSLRIKILEYKLTTDHMELTHALEELVSAVERARIS